MPSGFRFPVAFVSGVLVAIWAVGIIFHLWPVHASNFAWWHFPYIFTVIFAVGLPIAGAGFVLGCWWEDQ